MKIVTVLKTSKEYRKEHVDFIYKQCLKYASGIEFVCISDDKSVPGFVQMEHNWPRWWPKLEIFKLKGPVFYLDLDTVILKDIKNLIEISSKLPFVSLRDFYKDATMERTIGSGLMAWSGDLSYLYEEFKKDPEKHMKECNSHRWWGDQGFIEKHLKETPCFWQDLAPDEIVSWKVHCKYGIPQKASIIAFHGKPKPWEAGFK